MKLLRLFCRKGRPEPVTESSAAEPLLAAALTVLEAGGILTQAVRRYACSADGRFCALTLDDYCSYAVDLQRQRYVPFPTSGVCGFSDEGLVLSPDEERFSLELSGFESFTVDLARDELDWCYPPPHAHD